MNKNILFLDLKDAARDAANILKNVSGEDYNAINRIRITLDNAQRFLRDLKE